MVEVVINKCKIMDIIIFGFFSKEEGIKIEQELPSGYELVFDFQTYNVESSQGISVLKSYYGLATIAILVRKEDKRPFTSYPILYEISELILNERSLKESGLFKILMRINDLPIEKLVIAFADEWYSSDLVRVVKGDIKSLKKFLSNIYTWNETFFDLQSNEAISSNEHPLIYEIENNLAR